MNRNRSFWISLCLINLCLVAFLGFVMRSKMLFPFPGIDFQHVESAHSHFAFAGWATLSLLTLLIYDILPIAFSEKKIYQWILGGIELSALGMLLIFPFYGYNAFSIFFSTLYIVVIMIFAPVFIKDILKSKTEKIIKILNISAITSLVLSFLGTLGLVYILLSKSGNSLLYRDSIYTFLHFQYNGFFTLSIFALFFNYLIKQKIHLNLNAKRFAFCLIISVIPALFLSLLWHNKVLYYFLAGLGGILLLTSLFFFYRFMASVNRSLTTSSLAKKFLLFAALSFTIKMILNVGTIIPQLGDAIYGNRPVIIGFLHLVFLGFLSFYLLHVFIESNYFTKKGRVISTPFILFATGIILNEAILMVQGLGILFQTNSPIFSWLLWIAAIILFTGALWIVSARLSVIKNKKP